MKESTAYSLLVHRNAGQVRRLLDAIYAPEHVYAIHVDARVRSEILPPLKNWAAAKPNVAFTESIACCYGTWSLVQAELNLASDLRKMSRDWTHLINLSGQDFPVATQLQVRAFLDEHAGASFMLKIDPHERWPASVSARYRDLNVVWKGKIRHLPIRRPAAARVQWFGSSQWKILSREAVDYLLDDPFSLSLRGAFRFGSVPDEAYVPTVLFNSKLAKSIVPDYKRYIDWDVPIAPKVLGMADFDKIVASGAFFARKVDAEVDDELIRMLEARL
jgi:core-2/I-Branching enzyme